MAAADRKITYTAAEVAELIRPLTQSVEALQKENAELKRKLEHMNEILANAQRARFGQSSEKKTYILSEDQMSLFNEAEICFSLLKVLEHIGKRAARLQKRLALLVRQIVVLQSQDDILSHRELIAVIEDFIRRLR